MGRQQLADAVTENGYGMPSAKLHKAGRLGGTFIYVFQQGTP
jgi:hypothetical protein